MPRFPIRYFTITGDTEIRSPRPTGFQRAAWPAWKNESEHFFTTSQMHVEAPADTGDLVLYCDMSERRLSFSLCDLGMDSDRPGLPQCDITLADLGKDALESYVVLRHAAAGDFRTQDEERRKSHEQLASAAFEKLKKNGFQFGDGNDENTGEWEERARDALKRVTAYWFDLLEANGKLVPRLSRKMRDPGLTQG